MALSQAIAWRVAVAASVAALTALLFAPSVSFSFIHLDDGSYVAENRHVLEGVSLENAEWGWTGVQGGLYQPLVWMSLQLDSTLFGNAPQDYRRTSIALHVLSALLLAGLLRRLLRRSWGNLEPGPFAEGLIALCALVFALHPLRVESVVWISERKDTLSEAFAMGACFIWARHPGEQTWRRRAAAYALAAAAMLSKATLCVLPACFVLLDVWPGLDVRVVLRSARSHLVLFALGGAVAVGAKLSTFALGMSAGTEEVPALLRWKLLPVSLVEYVAKTFWPHRLAIYYYIFEPPWWQVALSAVVVVATLAATLALRRRAPELAWGVVWFLAGLLPALNIFHVTYARLGDRYTYWAHVGLAVVLASLASRLMVRPRGRPLVLGGLALLVALAAWKSREQIRTWKNWKTVYVQALSVEPNDPFITWQFADANLRRGDPAMALRGFQRLVQSGVRGPPIVFGLGEAQEATGDLDAALDTFQDLMLEHGPSQAVVMHIAHLAHERPLHPLAPEVRSQLEGR